MGVLAGEVGDEDLLAILDRPQRCALFGGGSEDDVGDGEDLALTSLGLFWRELEALTAR